MKRKLWIAVVALVAGCDRVVDTELEQELWQSLEIRNYQFIYTVSCFCGFVGPNPALITVRDGVVAKVEYVPGAPTEGSFSTQGYPTVDSLFARIDRVEQKSPAVLDVDFDDTYHYPRSIAIDYAKNTADDEVSYRVDNFTVLSSTQ